MQNRAHERANRRPPSAQIRAEQITDRLMRSTQVPRKDVYSEKKNYIPSIYICMVKGAARNKTENEARNDEASRTTDAPSVGSAPLSDSRHAGAR